MPPAWATCYVDRQPNRLWAIGLYSPFPTPSRFSRNNSRIHVLRWLVNSHSGETCELPAEWFNRRALLWAERALWADAGRLGRSRLLGPNAYALRDEDAAQLARDMRENSADWLAIGRAARWRPEYATEAVAGLVRGIYRDDAYDRAPVLADALDDAGCEDELVLAELRGQAPRNVLFALARRLVPLAELERYATANASRRMVLVSAEAQGA